MPDGFYIYGPTSTAALRDAAQEALQRLRNGEERLAVSPFCGTNFLLAGALTALGVGLTLGGRDRLQRMPQAMAVSIFALLASFRLGAEVQRRWTTLPAVDGLEVDRVVQQRSGRHAVHRVFTRAGGP